MYATRAITRSSHTMAASLLATQMSALAPHFQPLAPVVRSRAILGQNLRLRAFHASNTLFVNRKQDPQRKTRPTEETSGSDLKNLFRVGIIAATSGATPEQTRLAAKEYVHNFVRTRSQFRLNVLGFQLLAIMLCVLAVPGVLVYGLGRMLRFWGRGEKGKESIRLENEVLDGPNEKVW